MRPIFVEDPTVEKHLREIAQAVASVSPRPDEKDIEDDGLPRNDSSPSQMTGRFVKFFSKGPGIEVEVRHGLGRVPIGFLEFAREDPNSLVGVPRNPSVNRAWTRDRVYFVSQAPSGRCHLVLLT